MINKLLTLTVLCIVVVSQVHSQAESDTIFDNSFVHEIRMEFDEEHFWDTLMKNYEDVMGIWKKKKAKTILKSKADFEKFIKNLEDELSPGSEGKIAYLQANATIDGELVENVGVRLKGYSSFFSSPGTKKSIKIDFNEFNDTLVYKGIKKINLNNGVGDPAMQRDFVSYYLMRKAGVAAPRVAYAKVYLNDIYWGLYTMVEQVDKTFVQENFASGSGDLYKTIGWNELQYNGDDLNMYSEIIELKTNEKSSEGEPYTNLVKAINMLTGERFADSIQRILYTDYYFKVLAIDIISKNWDSYIQHGRNFYLYHEPVSELFYWIPWDYNLAWDGNFGMNDWFGEECDSEFTDSSTFSNDTAFLSFSFRGSGLMYYSIDLGNGTIIDDFSIMETPDTFYFKDTVIYDQPGIYNINFWAGYQDDCYVSELTKAYMMDTSEIECKTLLNLPFTYIANDDGFDKVFQKDNFCCDCQFDNLCSRYYYSSFNSVIDDEQYPIDYRISDKTLINKLLGNGELYNRYLDIFKYVLDSVLDTEELVGLIDNNTSIIREGIYADTNYLFSTAEFENDINVMCDKSYQLTSLTRLIDRRKQGLISEYESLNHTAQPVERPINKNDLVINEFVADVPDGSGESDWIELFNNTDHIISMADIWLSDDRAEPHKYQFAQNVAIRPNGFFVVWADKKDKKNGVHTGFKLSSGGEDIVLSHEKYDTLDVITFGPQYVDSSFARYPNGTGSFMNMVPTYNYYNVPGGIPDSYTDELAGASITAYPNPASTTLFVKSDTDINEVELVIFNGFGKEVIRETINSKLHKINTSLLQNGLYIIEAKNKGEKYRTKFIVQH